MIFDEIQRVVKIFRSIRVFYGRRYTAKDLLYSSVVGHVDTKKVCQPLWMISRVGWSWWAILSFSPDLSKSNRMTSIFGMTTMTRAKFCGRRHNGRIQQIRRLGGRVKVHSNWHNRRRGYHVCCLYPCCSTNDVADGGESKCDIRSTYTRLRALNKKLCYCRETARRDTSVEILPFFDWAIENRIMTFWDKV